MDIYEEKKLNAKTSESETFVKSSFRLSAEEFAEKLLPYDVISFDIFDTLIFRPFSAPADLFYLVGHELEIMDFKNIRSWAERDARERYHAEKGSREIGLSEIWDRIEEETGISSAYGQAVEMSAESRLCYANPFMLEVWRKLLGLGKRLILISDMYLPETCIKAILSHCGFTGAEKIYLSNEYHKSKADGTLFREVLRDIYGIDMKDGTIRQGHNIKETAKKNKNGFSIIHVGDHPHSDHDMARNYGFDVLPYQNANQKALPYRPFDMSPLIGSAYRAMVSNWLYSGSKVYSMEYEYGFIYGGLFVMGYCSFIHQYCDQNAVDKLLFLSRDGDILKQAYDYLYPDHCAEYAYWSRKAAAKLGTAFDKHDYFRRFIDHKSNQDYTVHDILHSMELEFLEDRLCGRREFSAKREGRTDFAGLKPEDLLTDKTGYLLRQFIESNWEEVSARYREQDAAAKRYYGKLLEGSRKAVAVDIGWAGSGAMILRRLAAWEWDLPCEVIGMIAGTNTPHNAEPDAAESFLQGGMLVSYLYSQRHNRDLLKKHNPNRGYNIFWELLLSSPEPQFVGFYEGKQPRGRADVYLEDIDVTLKFGRYDANREGIREIQRGILDFVREYRARFKDFPYMFQISGRDAYAPMLLAASHNETYLKAIEKRFEPDTQVN